jgi:hypothetical protein
MNRLVMAAIATAALGVAGVTGATQAHASTTADLTCLQIGTTVQHGNTINSAARFLDPCSGTATLIIQRSRWYGWEDMQTEAITAGGWKGIGYDCSGTGDHDFRSIVEAVNGAGQFESHTSWVINANCT